MYLECPFQFTSYRDEFKFERSVFSDDFHYLAIHKDDFKQQFGEHRF